MTTKTFYIGKIPAILYEPANPVGDVCVIFFHGRGENGNGQLEGTDGLPKLLNNGNHKNLLDKAEQYGFKVLAPQFVSSLAGWSPGWTNGYIEPVFDYALTNLTKLPKVGITGLSQGGGATWLALTNPKTAPKIFSAVAICPTPQYDGDFSLIAVNKIAVQNFHAEDDQTVKIASSLNMVSKAKVYSPDPPIKFEILTTGNHWIWGGIYARSDVYTWFLYAPEVPPSIPSVAEDKILYTIKTTVYESGKIISEKI